jgi:mannose-6-phosphate isomerase-like protein (cupin superfamily)
MTPKCSISSEIFLLEIIKPIVGFLIYLPVGVKHRVSNEKVFGDLVFIEVQTGSYFGEDDIVRIEDAYNRQ